MYIPLACTKEEFDPNTKREDRQEPTTINTTDGLMAILIGG